MHRYRTFYEEHKNRLFAYLMRLTGNYDLAGDIMQESFTRYLEHYGNGNLSVPLLYTIARNAAMDHSRRNKQNIVLKDHHKDETESQEHLFIVREEYQRVLLAMQQLDKDERDILALVVSGDFTYRQIAAITGISEANAKVKVHRSRVKLKEILRGG